jgi:TRAP-type C4-dicarboxylate transport system permease small subunit
MLAVMFCAFMVQIVFRYVFNFPIGWTSELTLVLWLWLVLWGAAFVLTEADEIRFDLLSGSVGRRVRIGMGVVAAVALIVLYGASFLPTVSYVAFMKVEKSSYLDVPFDWLFSIYPVFLVAILVRYLWIVWRLLRGREVGTTDPTKVSSGL